MTALKEEKDILKEAGIDDAVIDFFRRYQLSKGMTPWHKEMNGRFAINFKYFMKEGESKKIDDLDLLVAAAILLSHQESYFEYLLEPEFGNLAYRQHELNKIREDVRRVASYMSEYGINIYAPWGKTFSKMQKLLGLSTKELLKNEEVVELNSARYFKFFCRLPDVWGYKPKEKVESQ